MAENCRVEILIEKRSRNELPYPQRDDYSAQCFLRNNGINTHAFHDTSGEVAVADAVSQVWIKWMGK